MLLLACKDFAEIRNDYFEEIREFFAAETYFESFKTNKNALEKGQID